VQGIFTIIMWYWWRSYWN